MVYSLQGESCPVLWDNGGPDLGAGKGGSLSTNFTTGTSARTADDFVTNTCSDTQVCYIDAWIWSSCVPPDGFIELYDTTCIPAGPNIVTSGTLPGSLISNLTPIRTTLTGQSATIDGNVYQGYHLEFFGPTMPTLLKGHTYWLSAGGLGGQNVTGRAYFAYSAPSCTSQCTTKLSPGMTRNIVVGDEPWTVTTRDYAFRVFVKQPFFFSSSPGGTPTCSADFNGDGVTNTIDIFDYLSSWLAGCP
jgi:hypothetical protein